MLPVYSITTELCFRAAVHPLTLIAKLDTDSIRMHDLGAYFLSNSYVNCQKIYLVLYLLLVLAIITDNTHEKTCKMVILSLK